MFTIYKITSPSGRFYIGITRQTVSERWRQHVQRANTKQRHPFYAAIRKYGEQAFKVQTLAAVDTEAEGLLLEQQYIALTGANVGGYNVSEGGEYDWEGGVRRLAELREDPAWNAEYRRRLSDGVRKSARFRASLDVKLAALGEWREANPREAYRISMRNVRIAQRKHGTPRHVTKDYRFSKGGRLWINSEKVHIARKAFKASARTAAMWARRDDVARANIGAKISEAQSRRMAERPARVVQQHETQLKDARKHINHAHRIAQLRAKADAKWQQKIAGLDAATVAKMEARRESQRQRALRAYYKKKGQAA